MSSDDESLFRVTNVAQGKVVISVAPDGNIVINSDLEVKDLAGMDPQHLRMLSALALRAAEVLESSKKARTEGMKEHPFLDGVM